MATFLTTPRMRPELAARVRASVSGKVARPREKASPTRIVMWRLLGVVVIVTVAIFVVAMHRTHQSAVESIRRSVLAQHRAYASQLTDRDRSMVARVGTLLAALAQPYEGDFVDGQIRTPSKLGELLARPMVYVRGPVEGFTSTAGLASLAAASARDAVVLCMVEPPEDRSEKSLRSRARVARLGGKRTAPIAHVERLHSALVGIPLLLPAFEAQVRDATDTKQLAALRATLFDAPLAAAVRAARARTLLVVMDEPKEGHGPTEIDGTYVHHARVAIVDLETDELLLRLRKRVDPDGLSDESRVEYANGITSCELALDVRADATGLPAPPRPAAEPP